MSIKYTNNCECVKVENWTQMYNCKLWFLIEAFTCLVAQAIWGTMNRVELSPRYGIGLVGLYGVGGIGKSTICKALCNNLFMNFHGRVCHVELGAGNELELVREMLRKLTDIRDEVIGGYNEGQTNALAIVYRACKPPNTVSFPVSNLNTQRAVSDTVSDKS